jgi:hypothetical protein
MKNKYSNISGHWRKTLLAAMIISATSVQAATYTVSNTDDSGAGSLRQAILDANSTPSTDDIINITATGKLVLSSGQLPITGPLTINGPGADKLTIDGDGKSRIFAITQPGNPAISCTPAGADFVVAISGLTLTNAANLATVSGEPQVGGAVYSSQSLSLRDMVISKNKARYGAGVGLSVTYPDQSTVLENVLIEGNESKMVVNGTAGGSIRGGGLYLLGNCIVSKPATASFSKVRFVNNTVTAFGASNVVESGGLRLLHSNMTATITDSQIVGNKTNSFTPTSSGFAGGGYFYVKNLLMERVEMSDNNSIAPSIYLAGALIDSKSSDTPSNYTIRNSTFSNNGLQNILVSSSTNVTMENSTVYNAVPSQNANVSLIGMQALTPTTNATTMVVTNYLPPKLTLHSSIIGSVPSGGTGSVLGIENLETTLPAPAVSGANNIIHSLQAGFSLVGSDNQIGVEPRLLALANYNKAMTRTLAPAPNSPAIGAGANPSGSTVDQRGLGFARSTGGKIDIGAHQTEATQTVVEFYNKTLDHYFATADAAEATTIEGGGAGPGWERTGQTWQAWVLARPGTNNICRFYAFTANSHFFTADADECAALVKLNPDNDKAKGWLFESNAYGGVVPTVSNGAATCEAGYKPLTRVYNQAYVVAGKTDSNHRFTTDSAITASMVTKGWKNEGTVMCVL